MAEQENVLTSLEQYRSEVLRLPRLTDSEERDLEQRARLGDEKARQLLIESSLQYVARIAWRYLCYVRQDDYLDLVSVGNLAVVEGIAKALTTTKPCAYLRAVAWYAIRRYSLAHSSLVSKQRRPPKER
jgi:hypothetical protein